MACTAFLQCHLVRRHKVQHLILKVKAIHGQCLFASNKDVTAVLKDDGTQRIHCHPLRQEARVPFILPLGTYGHLFR
ncbi:hypothetical protein [Infectious spleen and kidney necrosis virus]|nr:hypothetical protein [Infectious spleen and kidney necrosis virus]